MRILCLVLLALVILLLFLPSTEPFVSSSYSTFVTFYNAFMIQWEKAITTLWSSQQTSQTAPTRTQLNAELVTLSQSQGTSFPLLTDPLPATMESPSRILPLIPTDPAPFIHALTWMNAQMEQAHAQLANALNGVSPFRNYEPFTDNCAALKQCQQAQEQSDAAELEARLAAFNQNTELHALMQKNQELVAQSKQIQNDAQSGALLNQLNLPTGTENTYTLPPGADALQQMKSSNPTQYAALQSNFPSLFAFKTWAEQINANLK